MQRQFGQRACPPIVRNESWSLTLASASETALAESPACDELADELSE